MNASQLPGRRVAKPRTRKPRHALAPKPERPQPNEPAAQTSEAQASEPVAAAELPAPPVDETPRAPAPTPPAEAPAEQGADDGREGVPEEAEATDGASAAPGFRGDSDVQPPERTRVTPPAVPEAGAPAETPEPPTPPAPGAGDAEPDGAADVPTPPPAPQGARPAQEAQPTQPRGNPRDQRREWRNERRTERDRRDGRREDRREERRDGRREERDRREERRDDRREPFVREPRAEEPPRPQQPEMGPPTRGLTLLGAKTTVYSDRYTPAVLEAFENRHQEADFFVKFNCPEFTSLCPITGQPDFATITINYIPDKRMVESKSLKLYLFGFRNHGAFHEDCVNIILKDLVKLLAPRYIEVWGKFLPRGGISIDPYVNYGRPTTRWEEFARQRLLMHDLNPERVDNR